MMPRLRCRTTRSRGPRSTLPDRDWAAGERTKLENLARWHDEHDEPTHAAEVRAKLAAFVAAPPKRFRADKLAEEYVRRSPVEDASALDGTARDRQDEALRSAVDAVVTHLSARQVNASALHLERVAAMADSSCSRARSAAKGTRRVRPGAFAPALAHLDALDDWPDELRGETRRHKAIIVVARATGLHVGTVKAIARRR